MNFTHYKIAEYTGGKIINDMDSPIVISDFCIDSRNASKGDLFVALPGDRTDGHYFIKDAFEKGAAACIAERGKFHLGELKPGQVVIEVPNTLDALKVLARRHREQYDVSVIGITGSVGKTTTKEMVAKVLSAKYRVLKTEGNLNTDIGLPLTLLKLDRDHDVVVLEMAMRHLGEISELCDIALPGIGVITNVAESHLETLKTMDNIAKAKGEILQGLLEDGIGVINGDDERVNRLEYKAPGEVFKFGLSENVNLQAKKIRPCSHIVECAVVYKDTTGEIGENLSLNIPGRHNLTNALAALLVGIVMGVSLSKGVKSLADFYPTEMRNQIFTGKDDITIINDTYNANVKSTRAALDILSDVASKRKIAVLGDMYELGEYRERAHKEIGQYAAEKGIDFLMTIGENAELIKEGAKESGLKDDKIKVFKDKRNLIISLQKLIGSEDTVLVKGSRGMALEEIVYAIIDENG